MHFDTPLIFQVTGCESSRCLAYSKIRNSSEGKALVHIVVCRMFICAIGAVYNEPRIVQRSNERIALKRGSLLSNPLLLEIIRAGEN